ncbi:hypothetical protein [Streptomyces sp. NPDC001833]|uniref:hypothetical protein n=1 Tax=Streptomyces sp. NPDC001833 TaxID=3154658 RepID=UPI00331C1688
MQPPPPQQPELIDVYRDFLQWRTRVFSDFARADTNPAEHLTAARGLLKSCHVLAARLEEHARAAGPHQARRIPQAASISTAVWIAVPALLRRTGYTTPPPPSFEGLLNRITQATMQLDRAGHDPTALRQAVQTLGAVRERVEDIARLFPPGAATANRYRSILRGAWRVSRVLLPFATATTAVACAPLLIPGAAAGILTAVAAPLAGILLPTAEELTGVPQEPLDVSHTQLLSTAAAKAVHEAERLLDKGDRHQADRVCLVAERHLDALLGQTDEDATEISSAVSRIRRTLSKARLRPLPPPGAGHGGISP